MERSAEAAGGSRRGGVRLRVRWQLPGFRDRRHREDSSDRGGRADWATGTPRPGRARWSTPTTRAARTCCSSRTGIAARRRSNPVGPNLSVHERPRRSSDRTGCVSSSHRAVGDGSSPKGAVHRGKAESRQRAVLVRAARHCGDSLEVRLLGRTGGYGQPGREGVEGPARNIPSSPPRFSMQSWAPSGKSPMVQDTKPCRPAMARRRWR